MYLDKETLHNVWDFILYSFALQTDEWASRQKMIKYRLGALCVSQKRMAGELLWILSMQVLRYCRQRL